MIWQRVFFEKKMAKVQSSKLEVEKFSGKNNFELWNLNMQDLLVQQGLQKDLASKSNKPEIMTNEDCEDMDARALNTIHLCLTDKYLLNISAEEKITCLWNILESLYMTKSLTNIIFLKRKLYSLQTKEGT
jgi:hypothetical protein